MTDEGELERVLAQMLDAAERAGVPRALLIIGVVGTEDDDGSLPYCVHVGRQTDRDETVHVQIVADALAREARDQAQAAFSDKTCPACSSPRMVLRHRNDPPGSCRYPQRYECMDCDYRGPDR